MVCRQKINSQIKTKLVTLNLQPRRQPSSYSPPWEPQILLVSLNLVVSTFILFDGWNKFCRIAFQIVFSTLLMTQGRTFLENKSHRDRKMCCKIMQITVVTAFPSWRNVKEFSPVWVSPALRVSPILFRCIFALHGGTRGVQWEGPGTPFRAMPSFVEHLAHVGVRCLFPVCEFLRNASVLMCINLRISWWRIMGKMTATCEKIW
jgi:hypothetical protein